jgi:hypothetical protein
VSLTALLLAKALYDMPRRYAKRALVALGPGIAAIALAKPAGDTAPTLGIAYLLAAGALLGLGLATVVAGYRETGRGFSISP